MTYQEVLSQARSDIGPHCKVCPECNGMACRGKIPGPGGKGGGYGFIRNYQALKNVRLNMDTIYEASPVDTSCRLFGREFSSPVFAAPVGAVALHYSPKYDDVTYSKAVLDGCMAAGTVGFTGDGVKDEVYAGTIKAIQELGGNGIPTIKPWNLKEVIYKAQQAISAGAFAFAMDIDAAGLAILALQGKPVAPMSVETLQKITATIKLPFILKGVMTVAGAQKALDAGAAAIVISNHGGRVLDETPATIDMLPAIAAAVGGKIKILIDGGFRSGLDIFKALALGADGVLIARPVAQAVYGGGAEGVKLYMEKIRSELAEAMTMTGAQNLAAIKPSMVDCID